MLSDQRQYEITQIIYNEGKANIADLSQKFNVTTETIRRDLNIIAANEKIKKVHGGAISTRRPLREDSYEQRKAKNNEVKRKIGLSAAKYIEDNDVIAIDSGTDAECLADAIFNVHNIKIITNSMPIAHILSKKHCHGDFTGEIILLGGKINPENQSVYGSVSNSMLSRFSVDKAFISATAVSISGVMQWDADEGLLTETLVKNAQQVYLIAESKKFDKSSFYTACSLKDIDLIFTDNENQISKEIRQACISSNTGLQVGEI